MKLQKLMFFAYIEYYKKYKKILLKCIVKGCNTKVLINLKTTDLEEASIQFFKMCKKHKLNFNNKEKEIKKYYENK